jgi:hypothetical protein
MLDGRMTSAPIGNARMEYRSYTRDDLCSSSFILCEKKNNSREEKSGERRTDSSRAGFVEMVPHKLVLKKGLYGETRESEKKKSRLN